MLNSSTAKPFGGSDLSLETGERGGAAAASVTAATPIS